MLQHNRMHCMVRFRNIPSNLQYKTHQTPRLKCFSSRVAVVFAQSIEARCYVENEDVVGAAPTVNYISIINHFITYQRATYIRGWVVFIIMNYGSNSLIHSDGDGDSNNNYKCFFQLDAELWFKRLIDDTDGNDNSNNNIYLFQAALVAAGIMLPYRILFSCTWSNLCAIITIQFSA